MFERIKKLSVMQMVNILNKDSNKKSALHYVAIQLFKMFGFALFFFFVFYVSARILVIPLNYKLLSALLFIVSLFVIISSIGSLSKALYLDKDNAILLTFPANPNECFISKLVVAYVFELSRAVVFIFPLFIAFGLSSAPNFGYYVIAFLVIALYPLFIVFFSAIISIPFMYLRLFLQNRSVIKFILYFTTAITAFVAFVLFINSLPDNIMIIGMYSKIYPKILGFIGYIAGISFIFGWFVNVMFFSNIWLNLLFVFLTISSLLGLTYLISRPLYFRLASSSINISNGKNYKSKNVENKKIFLTYFKKELKMFLRDGNLLIKNFSGLFFMPFVMFLFVSFATSFSTALRGDYMIITSSFLLVCILTLSSNTSSASAISREGEMFYLDKITPTASYKQIQAKLALNIAVSFVSLMLTALFSIWLLDLSNYTIIMLYLTVFIINVAHMFWSIEKDLLNPQVKMYIEQSDDENPNVNESVKLGLELAAIFSIVLTVGLFANGEAEAWKSLIMLGSILATVRIVLFTMKLKIYFKEIE